MKKFKLPLTTIIKPLKTLKIIPLLKRAKKAKRRIAAVACIILVVGIPLVTYTLSHLNPAEAAWWNDNWAYRREIPISAHTAAENNVYILPGQELTPTTFSGSNSATYISAAMIDSDSVVIAYRDGTVNLGKFAVYNTTTGAQELAPTTFSGAANALYVSAVMMDADSVAIAYDDAGATRGKYTVYNTTSGSQELAPTTFSGAADANSISVAKVDSNSLAMAYNDVSASRGKYTVYNTSTGTQELAPTIFTGTSGLTFSSIKMADADSLVLTYTDGSSSIGKFSVYNTTTGAQELTQTAFSGANLAIKISAAMVDSNSVVIVYDEASSVAGKYTVYNTSGAQELAPTTFSSGNNPDVISATMMDSDSVAISYQYNSTVGKYTVYNVSTGSQEYAETTFSGANNVGYTGIVQVDSDSAAIAYGDSASFTGKLTVVNTTGVAADTSNTSKFQSDCGDVRFTDASGNILPYHIVSGCGTSATSFHVFFENFPAGAQSIYMYYGNPSASNGFSSSDFATAATGVTLGTQGSEENAPLSAAYWKFDEGYGTAAFDSASATASATLVNMDSPASTRSGWMTENFCVSNKCIKFPGGASGSVTVSKPYTNIKTVAFWVKPASSSAAMITLDGGSKSITATSGTISANNFSSPTIYVNGVVSSTLTANQWNYVVVTTATGITAPTIKIGNVLGNFLSGFMDEVKLYSSVRDASQIKVDYNSVGGNGSGGSNVLGASDNNTALSNGLLGYWTMNESDGPANDSSGNGNNLTNNSGTTFATGKFANAGNFVAASTDYFSSASTVSGVKTVAFWAKPTATTDEFINLVNSTAYITATSGTVTGTGFSNPTVYVNGVLNGTITANVWNHIVVTSDTAINAANFEVGRGNGAYNNGLIDETRLYSRVLSGNEIAAVYNWAPGPNAYYKFEEGTGTTTADSSGHGLTGTFSGNGSQGPFWTTGKIGKGLSFNRDNTFRAVYATNPMPTNDFTYSFWTQLQRNDNTRTLINLNGNTSGVTDHEFYIQSSPNGFQTLTVGLNGTDLVTSNTSLALNQWYYVTVTRLGSKVSIYLNGVLDNTGTDGTALTIDPSCYLVMGVDQINQGCASTTFSNEWAGFLDDVKVYNYARTPSQITQDLNAGHPLPGSPVGSPFINYKFSEGYGTTTGNSGNLGKVNNGTINGALWRQNGKIGKALDFDTNNSRVYSTVSLPTGDFTYSTWIRARSIDGISTYYFLDGESATSGSSDEIDLIMNTSNVVRGCINNFANCADSTTHIAANKWYHIAFTRIDSTLSLYVNGKLEGTGTDGTALTFAAGCNIYIGVKPTNGCDESGNSFSAGNGWNGTLDEFKAYNSGLTAAQVKLEYNQGKNLVLGAMSDTSALTGGAVASNSAQAEYCVPGSADSCAAPVARWNFEEGTGSTVNDSSGNGITGTWAGATGNQWVSGKFGKAGNFNGANTNYVDAGTSAVFANTFSASAWVKSTDNTIINYQRGIIVRSDWNDPQNGNFGLLTCAASGCGTQPGTGSFAVEIHTNSGDFRVYDPTGVPVLNQWYFVATTFDGSTLKLYKNGVLVDTTTGITGAWPSNTKPTYVGGYYQGFPGTSWSGAIDDARIYDYARTPAQIAWDYNKGKPQAYWKADECQGTTLHDSSANRYDQSITIGGSGTTAIGTCSTASSAWGGSAGNSTTNSGKFNFALTLDGTDDYASTSGNIINASSQSTYTKASWGGWFNPATGVASKTLIEKNREFRLTTNGSSQPACSMWTLGAWSTAATSSVALSLSTWQQVLCTYDGTNIKVFINGVQVGSTSQSASITSLSYTPLTSGHDFGGSTYYSGRLDELYSYNYALTAAQIKTLYNQNAAVRFGPLTGAP